MMGCDEAGERVERGGKGWKRGRGQEGGENWMGEKDQRDPP